MRVHHRFITSPLHLRLGLDERARESQMSLQLARFALNRRGGGGGVGAGPRCGRAQFRGAARCDALHRTTCTIYSWILVITGPGIMDTTWTFYHLSDSGNWELTNLPWRCTPPP